MFIYWDMVEEEEQEEDEGEVENTPVFNQLFQSKWAKTKVQGVFPTLMLFICGGEGRRMKRRNFPSMHHSSNPFQTKTTTKLFSCSSAADAEEEEGGGRGGREGERREGEDVSRHASAWCRWQLYLHNRVWQDEALQHDSSRLWTKKTLSTQTDTNTSVL